MRVALLGSPGVAMPYRPVFQVSGAGVSKTGAAATYAAVVANHVLVVTSRNWATVTVTFTGAEASQAAFIAAINAQSKGRFIATNVGGQIKLTSTDLGSMSQAAVDAATSADVLASLGITATAFGTAATSARAPYGRAAIAYDGGPTHQRFLAGMISAFILDRNAANTVFSDNVQQKPNPAVP
jgi:hypothetical protein